MVIWSEPAKPDLRSIHDFIAHDSRHYARKVAQYIREKTDILDGLPKIGKKVPELNDDTVRELSLYPTGLFMRPKVKTPLCWPWYINEGI